MPTANFAAFTFSPLEQFEPIVPLPELVFVVNLIDLSITNLVPIFLLIVIFLWLVSEEFFTRRYLDTNVKNFITYNYCDYYGNTSRYFLINNFYLNNDIVKGTFYNEGSFYDLWKYFDLGILVNEGFPRRMYRDLFNFDKFFGSWNYHSKDNYYMLNYDSYSTIEIFSALSFLNKNLFRNQNNKLNWVGRDYLFIGYYSADLFKLYFTLLQSINFFQSTAFNLKNNSSYILKLLNIKVLNVYLLRLQGSFLEQLTKKKEGVSIFRHNRKESNSILSDIYYNIRYGVSGVYTNYIFLSELIYNLILGLVKENINGDLKRSMSYFPFILALFVFILLSNLIGLIPYSSTITSYLIITFAMAVVVLTAVNYVAGSLHGIKYFGHFLPAGCPFALYPLIIPIEFISYVFRVVSLSVRLFANMMAGHTLLAVLAGFGWTMAITEIQLWFLHPLPIFVVFVLVFLETAVAIIQAYVFTILTCMYFDEAINLH